MIVTQWYKVTFKYTEVVDDKVINLTEAFLFEAISYSDAETRAYEFFPDGKHDLKLHTIVKMKLVEVFFQDTGEETWFKVKVLYIIFDEKTKQEKNTAVAMLLNAKNVKLAYEALKERLGVVEDYEITDINTTSILEVVPLSESK